MLSAQRPPKTRPKSSMLSMTVGSSIGPRRARPTNAATEVATPVMVRTPLATSSM
jgi:hypothetical protein